MKGRSLFAFTKKQLPLIEIPLPRSKNGEKKRRKRKRMLSSFKHSICLPTSLDLLVKKTPVLKASPYFSPFFLKYPILPKHFKAS